MFFFQNKDLQEHLDHLHQIALDDVGSDAKMVDDDHDDIHTDDNEVDHDADDHDDHDHDGDDDDEAIAGSSQ
jgi:hypothetical protein